MKRFVGATAILFCCSWTTAAVAQKCPVDAEPVVKIEVGKNGGSGPVQYYYPEKAAESKPTICRNKPFRVQVKFLDKSVCRLVLKDFRSTYTRHKKWKKDTGDSFSLSITIAPDCAATFPQLITSGPYTLTTSWSPPGIVKVRMILFTAEMHIDNDGNGSIDSVVSFDPPWGERP